MSNPEYQRLSLSVEGWCCHDCFKGAFPFNDTTYLSDASDTSSRSSDSHDLSPVGHCSIFYSNCCSLIPKMDDLRTNAASSSPSVIALCETWLDESVQDTVLFIPNYHLVCRDRNRHGGGLLLFISDDIHSTCLLRHASLELLAVELKLKQHYCSVLPTSN